LNNEIIATSDGGTPRYLIRWKGKVPIDDARIDAEVVERYGSIFTLDSTGSSPLSPGENDVDIQPRSWRIYHR